MFTNKNIRNDARDDAFPVRKFTTHTAVNIKHDSLAGGDGGGKLCILISIAFHNPFIDFALSHQNNGTQWRKEIERNNTNQTCR